MEESMPGTVKKSKSNEKDINQQLYNTIYKKVTKENHKYASPQKGDGTIKKCIELFKQEADPNVLSELEKSLSKQIKLEKLPEKKEEYQKHYKYYIEDFLPALKTGVMELEVKPSVSNNEIEQLQRSPTRRAQILQIISEITKKSSNKDHSSSTSEGGEHESGYDSDTRDNDNTNQKDPIPHTAMENNKEENPTSPVSSRRSSVSSTLSSTEEDSNPQKEETGNKVLLEQTAEEEPAQVSSQCLTLGSRKKENMDPDGQATQMTGSQPLQPEEKKNTAPIVQKPSANKNNSKGMPPEKQPNNRNLHVALVAGCALSTIGCIVAGAMTPGLVGAGLLAMAAVFAIAAVAELHSNFLSSKLTSINVSPLVNDKELTAL